MLTRVPDDMAYVVERLGRYHRTLASGTHFVTPLFERVAFRHSLLAKRGELADTGISYDNLPVRITSTFRWRIVDPRKASYDVADLTEYITGVVRSRQREWLGRHAWKDIRETTRQLEADVARAAGEDAARAGVEIEEVSVGRVERA
ncbi:MAG TPA: SPFH domain-containing protein [Thermoanaerobaculia bacterium]|nr:SPFH domain-containing protein [Thermoanaerobaculia bacterium]